MLRVAVMLLAVSGCSFAFTQSPPPPCNPSAVAPIVDTAVAVVAVLATVVLASSDETVPAVASGGAAVASGVGAVVGFRRVTGCRDARTVAP